MSLPRHSHRLVTDGSEVTVKCPHGIEVTADVGHSPEEKRFTAAALLMACPRCQREAEYQPPEAA